jgi:hypothetical protein
LDHLQKGAEKEDDLGEIYQEVVVPDSYAQGTASLSRRAI